MPLTDVSIIPTYVAALNREIQSTGAVSWVRMFSALAVRRYRSAKIPLPQLDANRQPVDEADFDRWAHAVARDYGVTFVLYTGALGVDVQNTKTFLHTLNRSGIQVSSEGDLDSGPDGEDAQAVVFTFDPTTDENMDGTAEPTLIVCKAASAQDAIKKTVNVHGVHRVCFLGYSKLAAGLTIQVSQPALLQRESDREERIQNAKNDYDAAVASAGTTFDAAVAAAGDSKAAAASAAAARERAVKAAVTTRERAIKAAEDRYAAEVAGGTNDSKLTPQRLFVASHVAVATSKSTSLDAILQIAGRAFADLKGRSKPPWWKIQLLCSQDARARLSRYGKIEENFARAGGERLFVELKTRFSPGWIAENLKVQVDDLGVLGTRDLSFSALFGTAKVAGLEPPPQRLLAQTPAAAAAAPAAAPPAAAAERQPPRQPARGARVDYAEPMDLAAIFACTKIDDNKPASLGALRW